MHKKLPEAMGNSVAAFAHAVLSGQSEAGVWYPEEKEALAVSCYEYLSKGNTAAAGGLRCWWVWCWEKLVVSGCCSLFRSWWLQACAQEAA